MKIVYLATKNSDGMEGKGNTIPVALFEKKEDAQRCADKFAPMGYPPGDRPIEMVVHENFRSYEEGYTDEVRRRALSKLSDTERKALGL